MPKLVPWIFFIALFLVFLLPPTDPDLGWQLRCGQLFWQERSFCEQNQFSVLLENYSWPNHAWGYQAIVYPIWSAFSEWGLTAFNALLMTAGFWLLYLAIRNFRLEKMLGILLTIYLGWGVFSFGIRSQLMGFFFFTLTLYLLTQTSHSDSFRISNFVLRICPLPLVMLLWANTHGSVILGLILILTGLSYLHAVAGKRVRIPLLVAVTTLSGLVTLINPFGFRIYEEAWRHFAVVDLGKLIAEWVPPVPAVWWLILLSGLGLSLYLLAAGTKNAGSALLVILFTYWALKARRNVPFYFALILFLFLTTAKTEALLKSWLEDKDSRNYLAGLLVTILLIYGLLVQLPKAIEQDYCRGNPCGAIEFLKTQPEKGNIFNRYEWGGFLIWQLPEYKIFVDGRMPAWPTPSGKSPYTIYLETLQTQPGWQKTLENYDIDWILISPRTFMDLLLAPDPKKFGWQEVYRDKISVVYQKRQTQ